MRDRVRVRDRVSAAHQDLAHHACSQMNLQSDARAARGGSYLAYQSFMSLCSCTWGAAKSLQLPCASKLNSCATHQPTLLHMNWQSDARAARGGSYEAYQPSICVQCSRTQRDAGWDTLASASIAAVVGAVVGA